MTQKRKPILIGALFLAVICVTLAGEYTRHSLTGEIAVHRSIDRGQKWEASRAPDGTPGGKLGWDQTHFPYAEVNLPVQDTIDSFEVMELTILYYSEGRRQLTGCGVRMTDSTGEVFQWIAPANDNVPGWKTVDCRIEPGNFKDSWGGGNHKKIHFPLKLTGFAPGFGNDSTGPVWFGELKYRFPPEQNRIPVSAYEWDFDENRWRWRSWGAGKMERGTVAAVRSGELFLNERLFEVLRFQQLSSFQMECTLETGAASVTVSCFDGDSVRHQLPARKLEAGANHIFFEVNGIKPPVRIERIAFSQLSPGTRIVMKRFEAWEDRPSSSALEVRAETGHPLHLLLPDHEGNPALVFRNRADQPLEFNISVSVQSYFEEMEHFEGDIRLDAGEEKKWELAGDYSEYGIYQVNYDIAGEKGRTTFARIEPPGSPQGDFLFGICTHTERWGKHDRELEALAAALCGAKVIRTSPDWGNVQPGPGEWNYELFDHLIDLYAAYGIELQGGFAFCTPWGKATGARLRDGSADTLQNGRSMPDLELWREYVAATVKRYRGRIRFWEIWNEPDLVHFANFGVEDYTKLQQASYEAAKQADPACLVMNGGFAGLTAPEQIRYQAKFLERSKDFDIHAFHQHGEFDVYRKIIDGIFTQQRNEHQVQVPWLANETAMHSLGDQEHLQAESLFTKLIFSWARGAMGYFWYDLRNDGFNPMDAEHNYGMMTNDFYPKAVYPAYAALVNL